ncbi:MAG TPA: DUF2314 domain-containing protein [Phycisphaerales bacterium]|nr:DUF2314 domain-containing protein [Phycisphaerales bacterium]
MARKRKSCAHFVKISLAIVALAPLSACDRQPSAATEPSASVSTTQGAASHWLATQTDSVVVISDVNVQSQLAVAADRARTSADQARVKWASQPSQRDRWAIKWSAPTLEGAPEQVWVVPVNWSEFRIEGRLVTDPIRTLECGKSQGDIVSFPANELVDWVYLADGKPDGQREGGFTLKVLEERAGKPR